MCDKGYFWKQQEVATWSCKSGKYTGRITCSSVVICDEIIDAVAKSYGDATKRLQQKLLQQKLFQQNAL